METIEQMIRETLVDKFGVFGADLGPATTFDDLDVDSLVLVELAVILKRTFGVLLDVDELTAGLTVSQVAELVQAKLAAV
jgi:acyl carrier protein